MFLEFVDLYNLNLLNRGMAHTFNIEQMAKQCGDFFKNLAEYCYGYPKMIAQLSKIQEDSQRLWKQEQVQKKPKEKTLKNSKTPVDLNLPKKPLTAYISYFQEHKQRFEQIYPDLNLSDITKLIAKQWKERSDQQKKPYLEKAQNDRKRYEDELGSYVQKKRPKNKRQKDQPSSLRTKQNIDSAQEVSSADDNIKESQK